MLCTVAWCYSIAHIKQAPLATTLEQISPADHGQYNLEVYPQTKLQTVDVP